MVALRFYAHIVNHDSPHFILEESFPAEFILADNTINMAFNNNGHQIEIRARHKRQVHYSGQLIDAETSLSLGNIVMEPCGSVFCWEVRILKGTKGLKPESYRLFLVYLQRIESAPDDMPFIRLGVENYLMPEQVTALIDNYFSRHDPLWPLYYSSCHYAPELSAYDILSINVHRGSTRLPLETIEALWAEKPAISQKLSQIAPTAKADDKALLDLVKYLLEKIPGLSLLGISALIARCRPESMPLLGQACQSWYVAIDDDDALEAVLASIAADIEINSQVLSQLQYSGQPLPVALCWSLMLISLSACFIG